MKFIILSTLLAFSNFAAATPSVGDSSKFAMQLNAGVPDSTENGTIEFALVSQTGTDFQMSQTIIVENEPADYAETTVAAADLLDDQTIADIVTNCPSYGGEAQTITVPAGTFATCLLANGGLLSWIGSVPLGLVKQFNVNQDGSSVSLELMSFVVGKN